MRAIDTMDSSQIETLHLKGMLPMSTQPDTEDIDAALALRKAQTQASYYEQQATIAKRDGLAAYNEVCEERDAYARKWKELTQQRDELLAALRDCITEGHATAVVHRQYIDRRIQSINDTARNAIAKTEGRAE